jgi:hypothetical protein
MNRLFSDILSEKLTHFFSFLYQNLISLVFLKSIWKNDVLVKSEKLQNGAIYAVKLSGKWLYSGGWDKAIDIRVCLLVPLTYKHPEKKAC